MDDTTVSGMPVTAAPGITQPSDEAVSADTGRSASQPRGWRIALGNGTDDPIRFITALRARFRSTAGAVPAVPADCLFCRYTDPSANRIAESNKTCFVRFDNFPATPGHVEVVPNRHVVSFFDLTDAEVLDAFRLLKVMRWRLAEEYRPDAFTIGVNEGRAAGRSVDHLHIHLIPRHFGDVQDPRGGIRQVVPNCDPSVWIAASP